MPTIEISTDGSTRKCHIRDETKEIFAGQNFTLFCNVTLGDKHNLKIDWFKDVRLRLNLAKLETTIKK
jgi:hypothetical protein